MCCWRGVLEDQGWRAVGGGPGGPELGKHCSRGLKTDHLLSPQGQQVLPGKCWPFPGAQGTMTIALSHPIHVTHVSLEHLSTAISPNGRIDSAPKDFTIYVSHL